MNRSLKFHFVAKPTKEAGHVSQIVGYFVHRKWMDVVYESGALAVRSHVGRVVLQYLGSIK